jgi:hypothetical protein
MNYANKNMSTSNPLETPDPNPIKEVIDVVEFLTGANPAPAPEVGPVTPPTTGEAPAPR